MTGELKVDPNVYPTTGVPLPQRQRRPPLAGVGGRPPAGAGGAKGVSNILLVLPDDIGFGWPSTSGGLLEIWTADRLVAGGLRHNKFHTRAL